MIGCKLFLCRSCKIGTWTHLFRTCVLIELGQVTLGFWAILKCLCHAPSKSYQCVATQGVIDHEGNRMRGFFDAGSWIEYLEAWMLRICCQLSKASRNRKRNTRS